MKSNSIILETKRWLRYAKMPVEQARTIFETVSRKLEQFNVVMNNQSWFF